MVEKILSAIGGSVFGFVVRGALERRRRINVFRSKIEHVRFAIRETHPCNNPTQPARDAWVRRREDCSAIRQDIKKKNRNKFDHANKALDLVLSRRNDPEFTTNKNGSRSPNYQKTIDEMTDALDRMEKTT
jgi:hypothetical protein